MAQQQQQGGQMQGQGMQYNDQDIMQLLLNQFKHAASSVNTYVTEANNEQLRRDYMTCLGNIYNAQQQMFDMMQQKGYYQVQQASPQELTKAQNKFNSQSQQIMQ